MTLISKNLWIIETWKATIWRSKPETEWCPMHCTTSVILSKTQEYFMLVCKINISPCPCSNFKDSTCEVRFESYDMTHIICCISYDKGLWRLRIFSDVIAGKIPIPSKEEMEKSLSAEHVEEATLDDEEKMIKFQGRYCDRLAELTGETKVSGQGGKPVIFFSKIIYGVWIKIFYVYGSTTKSTASQPTEMNSSKVTGRDVLQQRTKSDGSMIPNHKPEIPNRKRSDFVSFRKNPKNPNMQSSRKTNLFLVKLHFQVSKPIWPSFLIFNPLLILEYYNSQY